MIAVKHLNEGGKETKHRSFLPQLQKELISKYLTLYLEGLEFLSLWLVTWA